MKIEIIKSAENDPVAEFFSASNTPEMTHEAREAVAKWESSFDAMERAGAEQARRADENREWALRAEQERDEARDVLSEISLYLSVGMGDQSTTAKQYYERILEGIKMLADPFQDRIKTLEKMLDMQTKIVVDLEMRLMKNEQTDQI